MLKSNLEKARNALPSPRKVACPTGVGSTPPIGAKSPIETSHLPCAFVPTVKPPEIRISIPRCSGAPPPDALCPKTGGNMTAPVGAVPALFISQGRKLYVQSPVAGMRGVTLIIG